MHLLHMCEGLIVNKKALYFFPQMKKALHYLTFVTVIRDNFYFYGGTFIHLAVRR